MKDIVLVNSGESILIFDLALTTSTGTSGLIKILHLQDILPCLTSTTRQNHPLFLQSLLYPQTTNQTLNTEVASGAMVTNYVHIQRLKICGASLGDIIKDDCSDLIQRWATL